MGCRIKSEEGGVRLIVKNGGVGLRIKNVRSIIKSEEWKVKNLEGRIEGVGLPVKD